jgi:hypothetical protein
MFSVEELNVFCNTTIVFILQLGVWSNQSFLKDNTDSRSSCSMHPQQWISMWKANLTTEFSAFLFLTFGIYNYVEMSVRKPNKSWNFQNKSWKFSRTNVDPFLNFPPSDAWTITCDWATIITPWLLWIFISINITECESCITIAQVGFDTFLYLWDHWLAPTPNAGLQEAFVPITEISWLQD